jgi:hypothetical protein
MPASHNNDIELQRHDRVTELSMAMIKPPSFFPRRKQQREEIHQ